MEQGGVHSYEDIQEAHEAAGRRETPTEDARRTMRRLESSYASAAATVEQVLQDQEALHALRANTGLPTPEGERERLRRELDAAYERKDHAWDAVVHQQHRIDAEKAAQSRIASSLASLPEADLASLQSTGQLQSGEPLRIDGVGTVAAPTAIALAACYRPYQNAPGGYLEGVEEHSQASAIQALIATLAAPEAAQHQAAYDAMVRAIRTQRQEEGSQQAADGTR